jgi:peptide/nickel transport system substrate-binding protein
MALRRLVMLGACALLVGGVAGAASARSSADRVLRLNVSDTGVQYMDPALNYDFIGWRLEFATCARLVRNPDKPGAEAAALVPEVAVAIPKPTAGGKSYTFRLRSGFRFSDGTPVTAESFARAVERALDPKMQSPAASFLADLVGAAAVQAGKARRPSGLTISGDTITFRLTEPRADFLARIGMPFFCAVPADLPIDPKGVNTLPGAGPYYIAVFDPDKTIILKRNSYYGGDRPQRWDEIRVTLNRDTNQSYLQVRSGAVDLDLGGLPPTIHGTLTKEYGINKGRYYVSAQQTIQYIALNTTRPFFRDQAARQAVAYAIDRSALMRAAGLNGGQPNDQLLPPGIPGYKNLAVFPNSPNVDKAKQLLAGRKGTVVMLAGNDPISVNQAQIIKSNLASVGITVNVKTLPFAVQIAKAGARDEPFDINLIGWFADYPDPYDFINILLYGKTIAKTNNINTAYFDDPAFNKRMEQASSLIGTAREQAYAKLDADLTRAAPFVVFGNSTIREFVSSRIGCKMTAPTAGGLNLVMLCAKTT